MLKKIILFFICALLSVQVIHSKEFETKYHEIISLELCQIDDLDVCRSIFVESFSLAYADFTPEELGVVDKRLFLEEAFDDLYNDVMLGLQSLIVAKKEGKVIGFAGFKETEIEHQIYITQLAVDPDHWHKGIGKHLVFSVFDIYENVQKLVVIPRRINQVARYFYFGLGFVESSYMHPGYNPQKYIGYEWTRSYKANF